MKKHISIKKYSTTVLSVAIIVMPDDVQSTVTPHTNHVFPMTIAGAIANVSSVAAMGARIPDDILHHSEPSTPLHKSGTRNSLPEISTSDLTTVGGSNRKRRGTSFLHINIPEHGGWTTGVMNSHLHLPTFSLTPAADDTSVPHKKFSFSMGLRRLSQTALSRSDSMASLCFRSLSNLILEDNLLEFRQFLENKRTQVDDRDENGVTPLILAATKGKLEFVKELINHGADVNAEDMDNWSALLCAAKEGYLDVCIELLDHGADIEHRDMGSWTALMWASYKGRTDVVAMLLERSADSNAHGNFHISSLLWAAGRGYLDIVTNLIEHGAKVNMGDKYGTSALVWACRKGNADIVEALLKAGANVDTAGMYSWTPLLVATMGNHVEVVNQLLSHKPNVNALDKDGFTALTIACKEGYHEIATALLNVGAYINIQDRNLDTNLIHAVKGGHRGVVEQLLKKYADVDICGKDRKTAIYWAVEKGNLAMVRLLLSANPDLEISTKDGDTPLLRAVRIRNTDIAQMLLDKKAKVGAADKKGDTPLHIAMRARSKAIVEVLLRNPKNSQLLYRPNRAGETPYNIDINHQKTILGQIFGARRLNTNEDNENMLGYDLYSSALADILSEPSLSMPITVGLYAKWGSGKSFLLDKLRDEMKNFARQWVDPVFQFSFLMFLIVLHIALIVGTVIGIATLSWIIAVSCGSAFLFLVYLFLVLVWFGSQRSDWDWPYNLTVTLTRKLNSIKLLLQVMFCHPPGTHFIDGLAVQPIRFYFTDQTRVSSTAGGENTVVQMLGSLYDSIESDYGALSTRLYRAFRPKSAKTSSSWRWRRLCCLPYIVLFELSYMCLLVGCWILTIYLVHLKGNQSNDNNFIYSNSSMKSLSGQINTSDTLGESVASSVSFYVKGDVSNPNIGHLYMDETTAQAILITIGLVLGVGLLSNLYTWGQMLKAIIFSQRRHLQRTIARLDTLKSEGFLQALRTEVTLMTDMVKCLDSFTGQQTRLVVIVDGLDSCEQDKVLLVLDAVHMLFSDTTSPFIVILAIDPHIISKAVEVNSRRLFSESNIGGHDYLRNMVHLPFFLQNSGLRNVKVAQHTAQNQRKGTAAVWTENEEHFAATNSVLQSASVRRMSSESGLSSTEKLKLPTRKGSRKLRLSESIASSLGSNLNRVGGAQDLTKMLLTDDYFSDVNPRSMRRLMNVVYVTGRLLKAFQIDFNWYHLASWVNITEQWPFRTSWLILHYDTSEDQFEDNTSLKSMYDKIRPQIPSSKEVEPLLELDRDERKFDVFLTFHRSSLLVSDLKVFLPFTINLDPYLKKVIKEDQQHLDESFLGPQFVRPTAVPAPQWPMGVNSPHVYPGGKSSHLRRQKPSASQGLPGYSNDDVRMYSQNSMMGWPQPWMNVQTHIPPRHPVTALPPDVMDTRLSTLNVEGVCNLFSKVDDLSISLVNKYTTVIRDNNINGRVLLHCDLEELKIVLKMNFGDWELFRMLVVSLREQELTIISHMEEQNAKNVRFSIPPNQAASNVQDRKAGSSKSSTQTDKDKPSRMDRTSSKHSVMEKQVTLEEQMICGALQTLNEEACEDVLEETDEQQVDPEWMRGLGGRLRTSSQSSYVPDTQGETDVILLQPSPLHHPYWQPVTISVGSGECGSASSSLCGTPVAQRKTAIQPGKGRGGGKPTTKQRTRPSSLVVSDEQSHVVVFEHLTPPASPKHHVAFRSNSSEDNCENPRQQSSSIIGSLASSILMRKSNLSLSEGISESVPASFMSPTSSIEKLHRLKDRFMRSVGATGGSTESKEDDSDDESTPLVSGIATPTVANDMDVTPTFSNSGFAIGTNRSNRGSDNSLLKSSPMSPPLLVVDTNATGNKSGFDEKSVASSCGSSISLSNALEPASNGRVATCERESSVGGCSDPHDDCDDSELTMMKKSLSGHFSRQDAVDQAESLKEYRDDNPETTV